ncbi:Mur ligase [Syncephalis fuscata]|nr:Mur ligase [Syncephalis fuscata]
MFLGNCSIRVHSSSPRFCTRLFSFSRLQYTVIPRYCEIHTHSQESPLKMDRNYEDAISHLNSLQSNAAVIAALRKAGPAMNNVSMPEIRHFLNKIGYQPEDLNKLQAIHIAGTKGKGSVCVMSESILRNLKHANDRPLRVGLFTSPHLMEVRERIRINGRPLSRDQFSNYFFECWDRFEANEKTCVDERFASKPTYFRYLTLMALHTFLQEKVDVAIMEVGVGGAYDSTNVIPVPTVCGITSLGIDHQAVLGNTLKEIAWHKAGIAKPNVPIFTAPQDAEAMKVIEERAAEIKAPLSVVSKLETTPNNLLWVRMSGAYQWINASLALAICNHWSQTVLNQPLTAQRGLQAARWPGRAQTLQLHQDYGMESWLLDGAHTRESIEVCASWYRNFQSMPRLLIFNYTHQREAIHLMEEIIRVHREFPFTAVIFCPNVIYSEKSNMRDFQNTPMEIDDQLLQQKECAKIWTAQDDVPTYLRSKIYIEASVEEAVERARLVINRQVNASILVTGSLHLVGNVMVVLGCTVESEFP